MPQRLSKKGFVKIGKVLNHAQQGKFHQALINYQAVSSWETVAKGFIDDAEEKSKAVSFKAGVLVVACLTKEVAYKIKVLAQRLVEALNEMLGSWVVKRIEVQI